jgi:hypothetical protein
MGTTIIVRTQAKIRANMMEAAIAHVQKGCIGTLSFVELRIVFFPTRKAELPKKMTRWRLVTQLTGEGFRKPVKARIGLR